MFLISFAERLSALLHERGITQKQLAEMIHITERHLSRIKKSPDGIVSDKIVKDICNALQIDQQYFLANRVSDDMSYYPVPFREAGGGCGGGYADGSRRVQSHISLRYDMLARKCRSIDKLSFVHASGDSMSPTIPVDASVLIDEGQTEPINNKIFYLMLNNEYYIKRLEVKNGKITALISDNGNIRRELLESDRIEILGRALMQIGDI